MSENGGGDDEATEHTNKTESHLEELVVHIEDIRVCYSKDPENPHPEDTSHSNYYSDDLLSPEEEGENEVEDDQVIAQPAEMVYSTSEQETNQSEVLSSQNSDQDHECGQTSEESQDVQEDLLSNLPDVHFDAHMLQQHLQIEQNNGEGLTWNEEDHVVEGEVLSDSSAKVKEEEEETTPVLDKDAVLDVPAPDLTEEPLHSSFLAEAPCIDAVIPLPVVEQTNTVSLLDESLENGKKVVAVQPMPQNVNVIFRIHYHTHSPYQKVAVTGNQQELGNWKEFIPLERAEDGLWSSVVSLPAESHVEWKFVVVDKGDVCRWEECGNRLLDTGSGDDLLVHRWWGIL
uniref:Starch-binding domain-containing protein 1 n=1 Tax=Acanthochromis polyacanthus TaxID=80966 RepID=A0A3Q1G3T2_9TELE